jgi:hypothetical protein
MAAETSRKTSFFMARIRNHTKNSKNTQKIKNRAQNVTQSVAGTGFWKLQYGVF